jgi:hypothetical protein
MTIGSDDNIPTDVDIHVGYMLDAAGQEWIKLTLTPGGPQSFSLAYSREAAQRLVDLLQAEIDRLS